MKKASIFLLLLVAALAASPVAQAGSDSFSFTFTDGSVSGSGTLYGNFESSGTWLITSGSGRFNDGIASGPITLIENKDGPGFSNISPSGYYAYDNLLFLVAGSSQFIDEDGMLFSFNGRDLNIWQGGNGPGKGGWAESGGSGDQNGTFTITSYKIQNLPPPQIPGFTISGAAVSLSRGAASANTASLSVMPAGGFTGSVALSAAITSTPSGAQYPPTLSFGATNPVMITGAAAGTATLTIATTAAASSALARPIRRNGSWSGTGGAALACVLLMSLPARRRNWRTRLGMLIILATLAGGLLACGGSFTGNGGADAKIAGTTAGVYIVTITGASGLTAATGTVTLNVQ